MPNTIRTDIRGQRTGKYGSIRQRHVTFRMDPTDVEKLDQLALQQGTNRSGVLKVAIRKFLEDKTE